MTMQQASVELQYDALRESGGLFQLDGWSSLTVTGGDRQTFLNNFCTNDVKRLTPGTSCEAFFTNVKGKIIGHALVTCRDNALVLVGTPRQPARLIEHLDRYLIREDVQLHDTTAERKYLLAAGGDGAGERFASMTAAPQSLTWNLVGSRFGVVLELAPSDLAAVESTFRESGFISVGLQAFTAARIEAGTPLFGVDFAEQCLPQEIGRDREAISFTKGCYLGQETVARIDALGHVNQHLVGLQFLENRMPEGAVELLHDGKKVGLVTSAAFSPRLNAPLAFAMVRREANAPGTRLESPVGACQVISLPLDTAGD
jgi:tRNA-modifying protein YgfZ